MYGERGVLVTSSRVHASDQGAKCFSLDSSVALVMCSYEEGEREEGERGERERGRRGEGEREGGVRGREEGKRGKGGGGKGEHYCTYNGPQQCVQESSTLAMLDRMVPK